MLLPLLQPKRRRRSAHDGPSRKLRAPAGAVSSRWEHSAGLMHAWREGWAVWASAGIAAVHWKTERLKSIFVFFFDGRRNENVKKKKTAVAAAAPPSSLFFIFFFFTFLLPSSKVLVHHDPRGSRDPRRGTTDTCQRRQRGRPREREEAAWPSFSLFPGNLAMKGRRPAPRSCSVNGFASSLFVPYA